MLRGLARRAVALVLFAALLSIGPTSAMSAAAGPPSCVLSSDLSGFHYYSPGQVGQAERNAAFHPTNPTAIVAAASGIGLYKVLLDPIPGPNETGIPSGQITYVYGTPPPHLVAPRLFAPGKPQFVIVVETLGNANYGNQVTIWRGYVRKWHAFAPWHFVAVGPIPGMSLQVLSNLTKGQVQHIAKAIIAAAPLGGAHPASPVTVAQAARYCAAHPKAVISGATVRGFFVSRTVTMALKGGAGGLYAAQHRLGPLHVDDTTPYFQVDWTAHGPGWIRGHWVSLHGTLNCGMQAGPPAVGTIFPVRWSPWRHL